MQLTILYEEINIESTLENITENTLLNFDFTNVKTVGIHALKILNDVIEVIDKRKIGNIIIRLLFSDKNQKIEESFIAFIVLQYETKNKLQIIFDLTDTNTKSTIRFILYQYAAFAFHFCNKIFLLFSKEKYQYKYDPANDTNWLNVPKKILPLLLIKKDDGFFEKLFLYNNKNHDKIDILSLRENADEVVKTFNHSKEKTIESFISAYLAKALSEISFSAWDNLKGNTENGIGQVNSISNVLEDKSLYTLNLFALLLQHTKFGKIQNTHQSNYVYNEIMSLIEFAEQQGNAIKEIAKNSSEHSTTGCGVLCGRFFEKSEINDIHISEPDVIAYLDRSHESRESTRIKKDENNGYLKLCIIDVSEKGILETNNNLKQDLKSMFTLFDPTNKKEDENIYSPYLKTMAKIGLNYFNTKIILANGYFKVHSVHKKYRIALSKFANETIESDYKVYSSGTMYNILIRQPRRIYQRHQLTIHSLNKIEYENIKNPKTKLIYLPFEYSKKQLDDAYSSKNYIVAHFLIKLNSEKNKYTREELIANECISYFKELYVILRNRVIYPLLDFDAVADMMDPGMFIRIIARIVLSSDPGAGLIIKNIRTSLVESLVELLHSETPFFSTKSSLLIYPKTLDTEIIHPIYLYGNSYTDFININKKFFDQELDTDLKVDNVKSEIDMNIFVANNKMINFDSIDILSSTNKFLTIAKLNLEKEII